MMTPENNRSFKRYAHIGLYPIVDSSLWLERLLPLGVKTIQLRIKDASQVLLAREIKASIELAKKYQATLFINDHWDLAIQYGADGVHLGQEDLDLAHLKKIRDADLYLGISTNHTKEVDRALACKPSYIACGPIYETQSKVVTSPPQGLADLRHWRTQLDYPLVAIGGITLSRLPDILEAGVEGVAVISAITQADDPIAATREFLKQIPVV